ncbi:MAG: hypothetical protein WCG27_07175 [Pseudomonadota bacterium]
MRLVLLIIIFSFAIPLAGYSVPPTQNLISKVFHNCWTLFERFAPDTLRLNDYSYYHFTAYLREGVFYEGHSRHTDEDLWADFLRLRDDFWNDLFYHNGHLRSQEAIWQALEKNATIMNLNIHLRKSFLAQMSRVMVGNTWPDRAEGFLGELAERRQRLRGNPPSNDDWESEGDTIQASEQESDVQAAATAADTRKACIATLWVKMNYVTSLAKEKSIILPRIKIFWWKNNRDDPKEEALNMVANRISYPIIERSAINIILQVPVDDLMPGQGRNLYKYRPDLLTLNRPIPAYLGSDGQIYVPDAEFLSLIKMAKKGRHFLEVSIPAHPEGKNTSVHVLSWNETLAQKGQTANDSRDRQAILEEFGVGIP